MNYIFFKMLKIFMCVLFVQYFFSQENIQKDTLIKEIQEVEIKNKRNVYEKKVDRTIFNVQNSTFENIGDAVDVLKYTPGIDVKNDRISMIGKSGMAVMVNDRIVSMSGDQLLNYLRSIPSSEIKSIEVITTPPAKYDAEGNGGLINIKMKKNKDNSWKLTLRNIYIQQSYMGGNSGINFHYNRNKISLFINNTYVNDRKKVTYKNNIFYPIAVWKGNNNQINENKYYSGRVGINYQITPNVLVGTQYTGSRLSFISNSENNISVIDYQDVLEYSIISQNKINNTPNRFDNINIYSVIDIDSLGKKVSLDFDYFNTNNVTEGDVLGKSITPNAIEITNSRFSNITNNTQEIQNYSGKVDIEIPLRIGLLSFGGKLSYTNTDNKFLFYNQNKQLDINKSNNFLYRENIYALYLSLNKELSEKWSMQLGIRLEKTNTEGVSKTINQSHKNSYSRLFPSIYLSYKISKDNTISTTYSRRINRPNFDLLNPFRIVINPYQYVEGNPFLDPSITDNYELIFNTKKDELKFYISNHKNLFEQVGYINSSSNIIAYSNYNASNMFQIGIANTYVYDKIKWLNSNITADISYSISNSLLDFLIQNKKGFLAYFSINNEVTLNKSKTMFFSLGYYYTFPMKSQISERTGYGSMNVGFKANLNNRINLSISINDILGTEKYLVTTYSNGIKQEYKNYWDNRQFRLSISYILGNKKIKVKNKNSSNQEEISRSGY